MKIRTGASHFIFSFVSHFHRVEDRVNLFTQHPDRDTQRLAPIRAPCSICAPGPCPRQCARQTLRNQCVTHAHLFTTRPRPHRSTCAAGQLGKGSSCCAPLSMRKRGAEHGSSDVGIGLDGDNSAQTLYASLMKEQGPKVRDSLLTPCS
jgi:hypothetical protein